MVPTVEEFLAMFPEFSAESTVRIQLFLDMAVSQLPESVWASNTKTARLYLAAHKLKMAQMAAAGVAGPVTSETVGELSRGYASGLSKDATEYSLTAYGLEYLNLRRQLVITPMHTGCA